MQSVIAHQTSSLAFKTRTAGTQLQRARTVSSAPRTSVVTQALFTKKRQEKSGYDSKAPRLDPAQPAFTRRREVFAGRLAMLGFSSSLIGEVLTGKGAIGQLSLETGLATNAIEILFLAIIGYSFIGGLRPGSPTFSEENQRDIRKRPKGPKQNPKLTPGDPKKYFGVTSFGFSKRNEVFVGRTAQLGFLASLIGEKFTGKGPLGQIGVETGIPIGQTSIFLVIFIAFIGVSAIFTGVYGDNAIDEDESY